MVLFYKEMKATANIATMPGRELQLEQTIKSIYSQFDVIRVVCNEMAAVPDCLKLPKIQPIMGQPNYTDNGKFYSLDKIKANEYYFTLDDDIIYPSDYVDKTIDFINQFGCIVSYHGRILKGLDLNYYRGHHFFHCNAEKKQSYKLDVCGTGVTAFRTDYFKPTNILNSEYKRMSDIVFSLEAAKQNKTIGLMTSSKDWIKPQMVIESIYRSEVNGSQTNQIKLANEIYRIKN
jgi:hypothetical protein